MAGLKWTKPPSEAVSLAYQLIESNERYKAERRDA
jgi:hypothetical protein